jgi:hypothetical protein
MQNHELASLMIASLRVVCETCASWVYEQLASLLLRILKSSICQDERHHNSESCIPMVSLETKAGTEK